jgi:hypothetical protein
MSTSTRFAAFSLLTLAALTFAVRSTDAAGTITHWSATSAVGATAIWVDGGGNVLDGDSCSTDTSYVGIFPLQDLICCSADVAYGHSGSCAEVDTQVWPQGVTTTAGVTASVAWANLENQDILLANASFEQVATIEVGSGAILHLVGSVDGVNSNWATVRVSNASGPLVEYAASGFNTVEFDEMVSLGPGSHQLTLSLTGVPGVPDFRSAWGEANLDVSATLLAPVGVSPDTFLRPEGWARIKALYR